MENEKNTVGDYVVALSFSVIVGLVSLMNKICVPYSIPVLIVAVRYTVSALSNFTGQRLGLIHVSYKGKEHKLRLVLCAALYSGSYLFQIIGLMFASSVINGILLATVPIITEIFGMIFLKERPGLGQNLFLMLSAGSVIAMVVIGSSGSMGSFSLLGFCLMLTSFIFESFLNILMRSLKTIYSPFELSFAMSSFAAMICFAVFLIQAVTGFVDVSNIPRAFSDYKVILAILFLGVLGTFMAGVARGQMLRRFSALKATIWYNLCTPITFVAGVLVLKEELHIYQVVCTILIVIGVIGTQVCKDKSN